ncbi:autophagy-related protein-like protein 9 [Calycina marina]|uniref:Autophagy-related protein 9 n=1 Tax=Calycina marina TaxID=1763456 RepID=A0A9P7YUU1_9HELO|nr:autophagy-related protein-like protein 9 [Calycina marina]
MMASNLLSRLLPSSIPARSIYDDLREHDEAPESDLEEQAGLAIDEENLRFRDDELGNEEVFDVEASIMTTESTAFLPQHGTLRGQKPMKPISKWIAQSPRMLEEDLDDDVPASLLVEDHAGPQKRSPRNRPPKARIPQDPVPGPSNRETRAQWEAAQKHQRLYQEDDSTSRIASHTPQPSMGLLTGTPREKAMYRWMNVMDVDSFIRDVYDYYIGSGIWCVVLDRTMDLLTNVFVAVFTTFLTQCVDFQEIPHSKSLKEVLVPQCTKKISGMANVAIWVFTLYLIFKTYRLITEIPRLLHIHDFYKHLLEIPDSDMQTVSWQDVVRRLMDLRDSNAITVQRKVSPASRRFIGTQSKAKLDAHDIANRLMRRENYMIALFNKEILDLTLPVPFLQGRQFFSRTMLWLLDYCIMDLVFNTENGQVRQLVLKETHRRELARALRSRFLFAGLMNILFAPVIVIFLIIVYFFRYFKEYQNNPSAIGSRQYTPLAEWKFREFNELQHIFRKRIDMSHPFASRYLDQFPKAKMARVAKFVAFVAGAIVSVLVLATLWDPELFLAFEVTSERTVLFYITVFGAIWAITNGSIPDENLVFEPEYALRSVIEYTHYMPSHWKDRLHSDEAKRQFATMYQLKIVIFLEEVLSILISPFVLWFSLPQCSEQIIDFFREFTLHVDGVGYVCSFAVFDFKKGVGKAAQSAKGANADVREDYYTTKHGKMAASYYGFLDNYSLNPRTGIPGHLPPGARTQAQFHPPPTFPGLMSPTLAADMQTSHISRSEKRTRNVGSTVVQAARTPRFTPQNMHPSPMPSILLDPHHQPSTSGFGGRSMRRTSRSRYQTRTNIIEEPIEDVDESAIGTIERGSKDAYESEGLGESRWETSPTRSGKISQEAEEEDTPGGGGVLGMLYQFQKAHTANGPGVNMV